jgi:hypothetical protein
MKKEDLESTIEMKKEDGTSKASVNDEKVETRSRKTVTEAKKPDDIRTTKVSKKGKISKNTRTLRSKEANRNAKNSETDELDQNEVSKSVKVAATTIDISRIDENSKNENILETKSDSKTHQSDEDPKNSKIDVANKTEKSAEVGRKSKDLTRLDATKSAKDLNSTAELDKNDVEPKIISCEVCHGLSIRPVCDDCSSIARKNKICAFCKQKLTRKSNALPVCEACKIGQYAANTEISAEGGSLPKRELVEWTLCKVCRRANHRVVCSSCVVMSQKHKICARCNVRWEDPQKTGMPVCPPCEKEWYPQTNEDNEDMDKCTECSTLQTTEVTLQKLCNKCNNSTIAPKKLCEPMGKCISNEVSIQVNGMENSATNILVTSVVPVTAANVVTASLDAANTPAVQLLATNTSTIPVVPNTPVLLVVSTSSCTPMSSVATSSLSAMSASTSAISTVSTLTTSKTIVEEAQINTSPSKKNVLLICKGTNLTYCLRIIGNLFHFFH